MLRITTVMAALAALLAALDPAGAAEFISYGSRAGMEATVVSKKGIGTANAVIRVKHTAANAKSYCVDYEGDKSKACVTRTMADVKVAGGVAANCKSRIWTDLNGDTYELLDRNNSPAIMADYLVMKMSTNSIMDGSSASGYPVAMSVFEALCPGVAP